MDEKPAMYIIYETYDLEEIDAACRQVWGQSGASYYELIVTCLKLNRREMMRRAVTTSTDQSIEDNAEVWQELADE